MKKIKSLEEVRRWKEAIYEVEKDLKPADRLKKLEKETDEILSSGKYKLKILDSLKAGR